jgi:multidrug efflux pump subunit AcrA (membrane-fusion protein)
MSKNIILFEGCMMKRKMSMSLLSVLLIVLSGCDIIQHMPGAVSQEAIVLPEVTSVPMVSVTGKVVPEVWGKIGSQTGGMVVEVLVESGDEFAAGDVLVHFDDTDARLAVQQAEAAMAAAEARVSQLMAGPRDVDIAAVEVQIAATTAVISQTQTQYNQLWSGSHEANVAAAEAQIAALLAEQLVARQQHDDTMRCRDVTLPDGTSKQVCPTLGTYEERTRFALNAVNANLVAAEAQLEALKKGFWGQVSSAKDAIMVAESQRAIASAQLDVLLAGTPPETIAVAETAVVQAQVGLEAAKVALERTVVTAPYAGTVGQVLVRQGEFIGPGQPLIILGNLATLRVETTDLSEVDIAHIYEGQVVELSFDALPNQSFAGVVLSISPMADPSGGGVNYTAIIEMDEEPPGVRWGMTAFVDITIE